MPSRCLYSVPSNDSGCQQLISTFMKACSYSCGFKRVQLFENQLFKRHKHLRITLCEFSCSNVTLAKRQQVATKNKPNQLSSQDKQLKSKQEDCLMDVQGMKCYVRSHPFQEGPICERIFVARLNCQYVEFTQKQVAGKVVLQQNHRSFLWIGSFPKDFRHLLISNSLLNHHHLFFFFFWWINKKSFTLLFSSVYEKLRQAEWLCKEKRGID